MIICFAALQLWSAHLAKGSTACNPQDAFGRSEEIPIVPPPHSHKLYYVSMRCILYINICIIYSTQSKYISMFPLLHSHKLYYVSIYYNAMWPLCITSMYHILYKEWTCIGNLDVLLFTNGVRCSAIPPHSHPQLDFHHFAITFQMDRGNCDYISNGSGQGLRSFFDFKFLFF